MLGPMPSPCIGICKMNDDGSLCVGCGRTSVEIKEWPSYDGERKLDVFRLLAKRRTEIGYGVPVLGYPVAALDRLILGSLDDSQAHWSIGVPGAAVEFNGLDESLLTARLWEYGGEVRGGQGGVRVVLDHGAQKIKMIGHPTADGRVGRIDLCLYTRKAAMSNRWTLGEIGPDVEALRTGDRQGVLFDLGLGLPHIDYCVRVEEAGLLALLREWRGKPVLGEDRTVFDALRAASPHRVLLTRMGRVEVWSPIPEADGETPIGPHSHLDPERIVKGWTVDPESPLPETLYPLISLTLSKSIPETMPAGKVAAQ
ncbi:MAG: DUF1289 domain-containing protein [Rhodospirillum sp.]|nr:DUF1289 domain-containing protein [Rhodospirillum sp.]MCF8487789.1 DUF1289 domain-containing protein [Rhodospirillum sp.]MCF8502234.1 DUF1289 domain-containing protein [Rhodospirillum sp.]